MEVQDIERSLRTQFSFDLAKVKKLYDEMELTWPDALAREYDDLVNFNQRITEARTQRLTGLRNQRANEIRSIQAELERLDEERRRALSILKEKETLRKFKDLQRRLIEDERELVNLQHRLSVLDVAVSHERDIKDLTNKIEQAKEDISDLIRRNTERLNSIRRYFDNYVEAVFGIKAILYVQINKSGNLDFQVRTLDSEGKNVETYEGEGTSYKKMLCACFDLALLSEYANDAFYRFVYHDGIFESLDDRKKVTLIKNIRTVCAKKNIQYILTVMASDMPKDPNMQDVLFFEDEIIRQLHDRGEDGRLFRMETF